MLGAHPRKPREPAAEAGAVQVGRMQIAFSVRRLMMAGCIATHEIMEPRAPSSRGRGAATPSAYLSRRLGAKNSGENRRSARGRWRAGEPQKDTNRAYAAAARRPARSLPHTDERHAIEQHEMLQLQTMKNRARENQSFGSGSGFEQSVGADVSHGDCLDRLCMRAERFLASLTGAKATVIMRGCRRAIQRYLAARRLITSLQPIEPYSRHGA